MARKRNPVIAWAVRTVGLGAIRLLAALPTALRTLAIRVVARVAFICVPRIRRVSLENLNRAYGDSLTTAEKKRIAFESTVNMITVGVEFPLIDEITPETIDRYVEFAGLEAMDRDVGGFMIGAHLGNWEWMAAALHAKGFRCAAIVRPLDDPKFNDYINRKRTACGAVAVPKDNAGQTLIKYLRDGYIAGVLIDQSPRENAVPVTFFGHECWATIAPVMMAVRAKCPIYIIGMTRIAPARYRLTVHPPFHIERSGDLHTDLLTNTQKCQDVIESMIREHPEQWLWTHRRWKKRPRLEKEWTEKRAKAEAKAKRA